MIQTASSTLNLANALAGDFVDDKTPLSTSAGFARDSPFAGQARQTFSLALPDVTIAAIRDQIQPIYDQLTADCWPEGEVLPFDMIRFDAFLLPETNDIKIMEVNTRNVGLHEVVEWLDQVVAKQLGIELQGSLNQRFVQNQKLMHSSLFGEDEPLLYMSPDFLPRWTYLEELRKAYSQIVHITSADQAEYVADGIRVDGYTYKAITKKLAWPATDELKLLDLESKVRILQPRWMRPFGQKHYLQQIDSQAIIQTETYTDEHLDQYIADKDTLVLKITDGGNSKAVYLGPMHDDEDWQRKLATAAERPEKWIVQEYYLPPSYEVAVHGQGPATLPTQLGIFILPCPDNPKAFDMDITVKAYAGQQKHFTFDPSGLNPDIWFGHVIKITS